MGNDVDMKKLINKVTFLYSFYYGLMPLKFGRPGVIKLSENELNIKKCLDERIMEQPDFYPEKLSTMFVDNVKAENGDKHSTENEEYYKIVKDFVWRQVKKFETQMMGDNTVEYTTVNTQETDKPLEGGNLYDALWLKTNDYISEYIKLSMHYRDIMTNLDKKLSDTDCAYSVDTYAYVSESIVKDDFNKFIQEEIIRDNDEGMRLLNNIYCGTKVMHDPETKKDYWVLCFLGDVLHNFRDVFESEDPAEKEQANDILLSLLKKNHPACFVLGEKGGYINPFSKLPAGYKGDTIISNLNVLPRVLTGTALYAALLRPLQTARQMCINRANLDTQDLLNDYDSFASHVKGFNIIDNTIYDMFDGRGSLKKIKKIARIIKPEGISKVGASMYGVVGVDKKKRLYNYLNSLEKENENSFEKLKRKETEIVERKNLSKLLTEEKINRQKNDPFAEFNKK